MAELSSTLHLRQVSEKRGAVINMYAEKSPRSRYTAAYSENIAWFKHVGNF